jgi:beta-aspartyl-peptidase (threonine type)
MRGHIVKKSFVGCLLCFPFALYAGEVTSAKDAIRKVLDDQVKAWNRGDLAGFMEGYWQSGDLSFFSGNNKTAGWQAALERYRKKYQGDKKEMGQLTFVDLSIDLLGPDHALVKGRFQLRMKNESPTGLFTLIVKKLPAGWRIIHDHTSG